MRTLLRLTLVALLATAGCDDGPTGPDPAEFPGTYSLVTYAGLNLPVTGVLPDGSTLVIQSGEMVVNADGTGAFRLTVRLGGSSQLVVDPGTWTLTGTVVRFQFTQGVEAIGDWEGDDLAITVLGGVYRFRR